MRTRLILAVGGVVVLALLLGLWKLTRDLDPPEVMTTASGSAPAPNVPVATDDTPHAAPVRDGKIPIAAARPAPIAESRGGPSLPGAAVGIGPIEAPPDADELPPVNRAIKNLLRKQVDAIDQYVADCVAKSVKAGNKVTGVAALLVTFRRGEFKGDRVVDVGIEPIDTTLKDPKDQVLMDCLAATGKKMELDLPDGVTEVTATHEIHLDTGALTDHRLSAFGVKTPGSP